MTIQAKEKYGQYEFTRKTLRAAQLGLPGTHLKYDQDKGFIIPRSIYSLLISPYLTFWLKGMIGDVERLDSAYKWGDDIIIPIHDTKGRGLAIYSEVRPINGHTVIVDDDDDEGDQPVPA